MFLFIDISKTLCASLISLCMILRSDSKSLNKLFKLDEDTTSSELTIYFEGLVIIIHNDEDSDYALDLGTDHATLFGSMVVAGSKSSKVCLKTKTHIKYSSQALSNASNSLSRIKIISWQNKY